MYIKHYIYSIIVLTNSVIVLTKRSVALTSIAALWLVCGWYPVELVVGVDDVAERLGHLLALPVVDEPCQFSI